MNIMNIEYQILKEEAEDYKILYNCGKCSREEAKEHIIPYLNIVNKKSKELSKKYNQRYKKIDFESFIR